MSSLGIAHNLELRGWSTATHFQLDTAGFLGLLQLMHREGFVLNFMDFLKIDASSRVIGRKIIINIAGMYEKLGLEI